MEYTNTHEEKTPADTIVAFSEQAQENHEKSSSSSATPEVSDTLESIQEYKGLNKYSIDTPEGMRGMIAETPLGRQVLDSVRRVESTWGAVDVISRPDLYADQFGTPEQKFFLELLLDTNIARALQNRYLITRDILYEEWLGAFNRDPKPDKLVHLSLGAGLWRSGLDALSSAQLKDLPIQAVLIDLNDEVRKFSIDIAHEHSVTEKVTSITGDALHFPSILKTNSIDTLIDDIDTIGIMEYFEDRLAKELCTLCCIALKPGGSFFTANITERAPKQFIEEVMGWKKLKYRHPDSARGIISQAIVDATAMKEDPEKVEDVFSRQSDEMRGLVHEMLDRQPNYTFRFEDQTRKKFEPHLLRLFALFKIRKV